MTDGNAPIPGCPLPAAMCNALEGLAALLDPRHHVTVLITGRGRPPRLAVAHRRLPLIQDIYADDHCFWWGWAERIGLVTNPAATAEAVARRLGTIEGTARD